MEQHTAFVINIYKLGNIFYKRHKQTAKQLFELEILQNAKQLEAQLQNGVVFKKKHVSQIVHSLFISRKFETIA